MRVLDHTSGIQIDPDNPPLKNMHALQDSIAGLYCLAGSVRQREREYYAADEYAENVSFSIGRWGAPPAPELPCLFNWFSITLPNYLRLVGLVELMTKNNWRSDALAKPANHKTISRHCKKYVEDCIPEIYLWRNKVAAHFAATDPFKDDSLGTLEQSLMNSISFSNGYYRVGQFHWVTAGEKALLKQWSVTETFEQLSPRFWPELPPLPPFRDI